MNIPNITKPLSANLKSNDFCVWLHKLEEKVAAKFASKNDIDTAELIGITDGMDRMLLFCRSDKFEFPTDETQTGKVLSNFFNKVLENSIQDALLKRKVEKNRFNCVDPIKDEDGLDIDILDTEMPQDSTVDEEAREFAIERLKLLCAENGFEYCETDDEYSLQHKLAKSRGGNTIITYIWEFVNENGFVDTPAITEFVKGKLPTASTAAIKVAISQCRNSGKEGKQTHTEFATRIHKPEMTFSDFVVQMSSRDAHIKTITRLWRRLKTGDLKKKPRF